MNDCCYGEKLIAAGTAIAFQLAQECRPEDLELLSDLFNVIGEQLALLANTKAIYKLRCDSSRTMLSEQSQGTS